MRFNILLIFFLLFFCTELQAQTKYDFPQFWHETGQFFSIPAHWNAFDLGTFALLGGLTAAMMETELPARDVKFISRDFYYSPEAIGGRMYGELYTPFIIFSAYAGYSLLSKDQSSAHQARKIAYEIGQSCLYAAAIVTVLKVTVGRARPLANEGKFSFEPLTLFDDYHHSFPSGHTTEAFTMSTILSMNAHSTLLKVLAYVPAFFTPFSRAYQGWHWISDCVFGAGIGYFTAKWITDLHAKNEAAAASSTTSAHSIVSQLPVIYPVSFNFSF
jgi:membrane-associated phospholipid phosphatase